MICAVRFEGIISHDDLNSVLIEFVGNIFTQPLSKVVSLIDRHDCHVRHHGFGQVIQVLLSNSSADVLIVHLTSSYFFPSFLSADDSGVLLSQLIDAISFFTSNNNTLLVLNTVPFAPTRIVGANHKLHFRAVAAINESLLLASDQHSLVSVADLAGLLLYHGSQSSISLTNEAMMKMPYKAQFLPYLLSEYARVINERYTPRKKVILLDADNTLWGGVVGEDGVYGIKLDRNYPGVIYYNFQLVLLQLQKSGLILCLVSKNNEADVLEAFDELSMPLGSDSFAVIRANWQSKSSNIARISDILNVSTDSMIFIDDNPLEISEVTSSFPDITAITFDLAKAADPISWLSTLEGISIWQPNSDDVTKTQQYRANMSRNAMSSTVSSHQEFLVSLQTHLYVGINRNVHSERIAQLCNKTNQFNLTTRRYSQSDILAFMKDSTVFDFRASDRFGDLGIIGVVIVQNYSIDTFLLSCRALGRNIEHDMLSYAVSYFQGKKLKSLFILSPKNSVASRFYDEFGFSFLCSNDDTREYESDPSSMISFSSIVSSYK